MFTCCRHSRVQRQDPVYASRIASLPVYTASLQARYPPVCASCLPGVEEEIARKDSMARTRALGGALKASSARGKGKGRAVADASKQRRSLFVWKARGFLWFTTFMLSVVVHTAGMSWLVRIMELVLKPWSRHHWAESLKYAELYTLLSRCSHYIFVVDPLGSNVFPPSTIRDAWQGSTSRWPFEIYCESLLHGF